MGKVAGICLFIALCLVVQASTKRTSRRGVRHRREAIGCSTYCTLGPHNRTMCPETDPVPENRVDTTQQLSDLRAEMENTAHTVLEGGEVLNAYLVYEGSYYGGGVTDHDRRMKFISGFSGSAGNVIVTTERAALWTDGRYWLQGDQELDCNWILMKDGDATYPDEVQWLLDIMPQDAKVGVDPSFIDTQTYQKFEEAFKNDPKNIMLHEVPQDLIDHIWTTEDGRPDAVNNPIYEHTIAFAGQEWKQKLINAQAEVADNQVLVLTLLDDIVWLFNVRGADRTYSPVFDSMAFVWNNKVTLYVNNLTLILDDAIQTHLHVNENGDPDSTVTCADQCVSVRELSDAISDLEALANDTAITSIWINPDVAYNLYKAVGEKRHEQASPIQLPKSQKNDVERQGYADCQLRDSAILVRFSARLEQEIAQGVEYTEVTAGALIDSMRAEDINYKMLSFATIAGYGTNGAVIHYRASEATDLKLGTDSLFLLDSGGNYLDGTTDVTRTFHFGTPTAEQKEAYTRTLMGVIDLASTVWPEGWRGSDIDARARTPIWQNGWDFNHGTGHGIAYFINVHEGPSRISIRATTDAPIKKNMFFSDEPGIYLDGKFGVRLETIVQVAKANVPNSFNDKEYLTFLPYTLVPFEPHIINYDLLERHHRQWLNAYNQRCLLETGELVRGDQRAYDWMVARTQHIPDEPIWQATQCTDGAPTTYPGTLLVLILGLVNIFVAFS